MRHRTYYVRMPTNAGSMPYLDIFVGGQSVGTPAAPVGYGAGLTTPPAGWQTGADFAAAPSGQGDGQFYESMSLPLRVEENEGGVLRLGYSWAVAVVDPDADCTPPPLTLFSETLVGGDFTGVFANVPFADPSYGPSIRLVNTVDTQGVIYVCNLAVYNAREVDRAGLGA